MTTASPAAPPGTGTTRGVEPQPEHRSCHICGAGWRPVCGLGASTLHGFVRCEDTQACADTLGKLLRAAADDSSPAAADDAPATGEDPTPGQARNPQECSVAGPGGA